jgi:tetratricopeptide (TPR) repeat protein
MNLLLDALKTAESSPTAPYEQQEEPLDGAEILTILTENAASNSLTLEASPVSAAPTAPPPSPTAALPPRNQTNAVFDSAGRATHARATTLPPQAMSPLKRYAVMFAAAVAAVIVIMFGKSLLQPTANPSGDPDAGETPTAVTRPAAAPDTSPIQVLSARPASQFSYAGDAPEIDLKQDVIAPAEVRTASDSPIRTTATDARGARLPVAPSAADHTMQRTLSVTTSAGLAPVDQRIEAGYRALATGNVTNARRDYLAALELDPNNIDALLGIAGTAARDGNAAVAIAAYKKALTLEPGNMDATAALAMLIPDRSAGEANESRLKIMIAADAEQRPALHTALAGVYAADARWADAAQEYFIALSQDPSNSDLAFNVAASLDQIHKTAAALTYYAQALEFAKRRPAQIDAPAIEKRISQLQARTDSRPPTPKAAP